jgi:hypothetical protein
MDARTVLLQAIEEIKGPEVRASVESGEGWLTSVDSLDLLEILVSFDDKLGCVTDPQQLPGSLDDFDAVVAQLNHIHGLA